MKKLIATVIGEFKAADQNMYLDEDEERNFKIFLDNCKTYDQMKERNL